MIRKLSGNSGCELSLIKCNGTYLVEKKAGSISYNERLKLQCKKQKNFHSNFFKSVQIVKNGYTKDGLFYFDMEYISGITMAEYIENISLSEIDNIAEFFFKNSVILDQYDNKACLVFKNKINCIQHIINLDDSLVKDALDYLEQYHWQYIIPSKCHGDFTLENMLVSNGEIYLIDFLDSFYDSWMIDCAKILQDVELRWHYRNEKRINVNLALRLLILKENLVNRILKMRDGEYLMESIYHILLLNILRIFPYATDLTTISYLKENILYLRDVIDKKHWTNIE